MPFAFCCSALAQTYPSEAWPADATLLALDGTTHSQTGLPFISIGTSPQSAPSLAVQLYRERYRENAILAAVNQGRVADEGGLNVGVWPIVYYQAGTRKSYAGATGQVLVDDDTTHLWLDAANTLQTGLSGFPTDVGSFLPIAQVTTAAGDITAIVDERTAVLFEVPGSVPYSPTLHDDSASLTVGVRPIVWVSPVSWTLVDATGYVVISPAGSSLRVDVRKSLVSIFASDAEKIVIPASGVQDTSATKNVSIAAGDRLDMEVEQIGSSIAGGYLVVVLNGRVSPQP